MGFKYNNYTIYKKNCFVLISLLPGDNNKQLMKA